VELIGRGRRSHVYRAIDRHLSSEGFQATVAIKVLRAAGATGREALAARRIEHPNVLGILDHGRTADGAVYVVSEYIDAGDLSQAQAPWEPRRGAEFVRKLAGAVQAAHSAGVVHCDLKPANILLTSEGEPKLVDFDLARWGTDSGASRGNLAFMSPEQFRGERKGLTPPSDIYALGGVLYYILTAKLPNGATPDEVAKNLGTGEPRPRPGAGRDLDAICARAMHPDREQRYHSAGEMADDLERWMRHEPIPWTRPSTTRRAWLLARRRPVKVLVAAGAIGALIAGAGVHEYNAARERQREERVRQESDRKTKEMIERTSERVRSHIRFFAQTFLTDKATHRPDEILPSLVWIQFLLDSPVLTQEGSLPSMDERVRLLQTLVEESLTNGGAANLETLLARYTLAYFLVDTADYDGALSQTAEMRERWTGRLDEHDPLWLGLRGIEACANAGRSAGSPDGRGPRETLAPLSAELEKDGRCEPVHRLVERTLARLDANRK
jgi:serine/threonine-protein kinase